MEHEETNTTKPPSIEAESESNRRRHNQRQLSSELEEEDDDDDDDDDEGNQEENIERSRSSSNKEIIKELKNIQRQNTITHYLLTASILVTLAWQLSEFSLIFRIKQGFTNPLKSVREAIKDLFNFNTTPQNNDHRPIQITPPTYLPGLKIPDWPGFDTSTEDNDDED